jgi:hypothetical protein
VQPPQPNQPIADLLGLFGLRIDSSDCPAANKILNLKVPLSPFKQSNQTHRIIQQQI